MNYEEMSDIVIDRKVFSLHFGDEDKDMERIWKKNKFRPCSQPNVAWPIIEEMWERLMRVDSYYQAHTRWEAYCIEHGVGKLRAAMICFLKMKEAENG